METKTKVISLLQVIILYSALFLTCSTIENNFASFQAEVGQFPFIVAVVARNLSVSFCTGTILSDRWVITAESCIKEGVKPVDYKIHAGILSYRDRFVTKSAQILAGNKIVTKSLAEITEDNNNISVSLIKTEDKFRYNMYVKAIPILLLKPEVNALQCETMGYGFNKWGSTKSLSYTFISRLHECSEVLEKQSLDPKYFFCSNSKSGVQMWDGDYGSPVVCQDGVVGVSVYKQPKIEAENNTIVAVAHIVIYKIVDWIKEFVPDMLECSELPCHLPKLNTSASRK